MNQAKLLRENTRILECHLGNINKTDSCCCGISEPECFVLVEIGRKPNISVKELAEILRLDKSGVSRTVEELVQKDYVERNPSTEDRIFVANLREFECCHIFDRKGKFIKKLARKGRAGNEYTYLADIFYNPDSHTINLLGRFKAKILSFDKDGNEVAVYNELPAEFTSMEYHKGKYYGTTGGLMPEKCDSCDLVVMNSQFEIEKCLVKNAYAGKHLSNDSFYLYDGEIFYTNNWLMQVINPKSGETRWEFDFGSYRRPKELDNPRDYFEYIDKNGRLNNKVTNVSKINESKDYVVCEFNHSFFYALGIYDKQTKSSNVVISSYMEQPYALPFGDICTVGESHIITTISASSVARLQRGKDDYGNDFTKEFPKQIERLRADFPTISEEDNPFIAIYTLKE